MKGCGELIMFIGTRMRCLSVGRMKQLYFHGQTSEQHLPNSFLSQQFLKLFNYVYFSRRLACNLFARLFFTHPLSSLREKRKNHLRGYTQAKMDKIIPFGYMVKKWFIRKSFSLIKKIILYLHPNFVILIKNVDIFYDLGNTIADSLL